MPKFIAKMDMSMSVSGMRFVPIMLEHNLSKTPIVLVRIQPDDMDFTVTVVANLVTYLNEMLDPDVPFEADEVDPHATLKWDRDDRAPHPTAPDAAYYIQPNVNGGYLAFLDDGATKDRRILGGQFKSVASAKQACEEQYQVSIT
jgi:hypothetical protein